MDVCLLLSVACWQVEVSARVWSLVLPTVVGCCVWSRNLVNEEAMVYWELLRRKKNVRLGLLYSGADKFLARPGMKQANVSVRMAWISFGALSCRKKIYWWHLASRCCWNRARFWHASELASFLVGLRTYQHPGILSANFGCHFLLWIRKKLAYR